MTRLVNKPTYRGLDYPGGRHASRPVLFIDGECGVCSKAGALVGRWDREARIDIVAIQSATGDRLLGNLDPEEREGSWHLLLPDGRRFREADVLAELIALLPGGCVPARVMRRFPSSLGNPVYRAIARRRHRISRLFGLGTCAMPES